MADFFPYDHLRLPKASEDRVWKNAAGLRFLLVALLLLTSVSSRAQQVSGLNAIHWQPTIYSEKYVDMIPVGSNGIIELRAPGTYGFILHRVNSVGQPLWQTEVGSTDTMGSLFPEQLVVLPNSDFLVTGFMHNSSSTHQGAFAMRYDTSGNLLWKKMYPVDQYVDNHVVTVFSPSGQGSLYFTFRRAQPPLNDGTAIIKTDLNGNVIDSAFIGLQNFHPRITQGFLNSSGNIVLAGGSGGSNGTYAGILEFDTALNLVCANIITGFNVWVGGGTYVTALNETAGGDYLMATTDDGGYSFLFRLDSIGQILHYTQMQTNTGNGYTITDLQKTSSGDFYAVVWNDMANWPGAFSKLAHFDDTGAVISVERYDASNLGFIICYNTPLISVTGYTSISSFPVAYIQTDSAGHIPCSVYAAPVNFPSPPVLNDTSPAPIILGAFLLPTYIFTDTSITANAINVSNFCLNDNVASSNVQQPEVWPVPAGDFLYVNWPDEENTSCTVYDVNGRLVFSSHIVNGKMDVSSLARGYYILIADHGDNNTVRKPFVKQ